MIQQSKGKIFLADERGVNQTERFQSRHTFNFGNYFNEHKHAFGDVYVLNDDTLAGAGAVNMFIKEDSYIILLPVAGAINYKLNPGNSHCIAAGQVAVISAPKGSTIEISNPFDEEYVNFIQVWIRLSKPNEQSSPQLSTYDDVNENLNRLVQAFPNYHDADAFPFSIAIGKFSGRGETSYKPTNKNKAVFIFVLEGAFEVEGRLLHARDGLALWEMTDIEIEALSNDAILFLAELSL